jgi:CBS domain-containing protein
VDVRDIMTPSPFAVGPTASVSEVAQALVSSHARGVPVVDAENNFLGLVTERDVVAKQARLHLPIYIGFLGLVAPIELPHSHEDVEHALAVNAEQLMETNVVTAVPTSTIEDVATLMVDEDVDAIPILDGKRLVGLVNRLDLVRLVVVEERDDAAAGGS